MDHAVSVEASPGTGAPQRSYTEYGPVIVRAGIASSTYLREIDLTKIFVVAIGFAAAVAAFPSAAQTGYGVKKNAPSTSTFDRGWNHANESKDRARAGAAYVRHHSHK
jgi:hypothetical protein